MGPIHRLDGRWTMRPRAEEIMGKYGADDSGTLAKLARLLNHIRGRGKLLSLPVDQRYEHRLARSFAPNPPAYDPRYHFELGIEAGCNAYFAALGFPEAVFRDFARGFGSLTGRNSFQRSKQAELRMLAVIDIYAADRGQTQ